MNDPDMLYTVAAWIIPLVIAIVFHEVAHGYVARLLGDDTAARRGCLTLNPIRHIDPIGTVILPLFLAVVQAPIFGWARPVPVDARQLRNPRRDMMVVGIAGPATNFAMALATALLLAAIGPALARSSGGATGGIADFLLHNLVNFLQINVFLGVFNLIPLPPFDGGHVVHGLLPRGAAEYYARLAPLGFPVLLFLLFVLPMIGPQADVVRRVVGPIAQGVTEFFFRIAQAGGG